MIDKFTRKAENLLRDPVLRRWLVGRAIGRYASPPGFTAHRPPYLNGTASACESAARPELPFSSLHTAPPTAPVTLDLPGEVVTLRPDAPETLFARDFADTETLLAVHRFAWLPVLGKAAPHDWLDALWRAWLVRHADPDESWVWHPYTTAERAINILRFARVHGLPGNRDETLAALARHGPAIAANLEYFGNHDTGNHLSNNGRGLYLLGLELGQDRLADLGARILLAEAGRIFTRSGLLREGSSHYHLLLTRNYAEAWLTARAHGRAEAGDFEFVARSALEATPALTLPGGMPLIGDISPDCPPEFLTCLLPGGNLDTGWAGLLSKDDRSALTAMIEGLQPTSPARVATAGWHRLSRAAWTLLSYASPDGWAPTPGHAHQDMGSFELHRGTDRIIVDPGRGAYGAEGEAAMYAAARAHNGLRVDGHDPYPPNKPYYNDAFRRAISGPSPLVTRVGAALTIAHDGFTRLRGVDTVTRCITLEDDRVIIEDTIDGVGTHTLAQRLHTILPVTVSGNAAVLGNAGKASFVLRANVPVRAEAAKRWTAYGRFEPATALDITSRGQLPARLRLEIASA